MIAPVTNQALFLSDQSFSSISSPFGPSVAFHSSGERRLITHIMTVTLVKLQIVNIHTCKVRRSRSEGLKVRRLNIHLVIAPVLKNQADCVVGVGYVPQIAPIEQSLDAKSICYENQFQRIIWCELCIISSPVRLPDALTACNQLNSVSKLGP